MKNYEEMAAEAIRRRDIYLQQRCGRIKKAVLILTVLLLFTVVGTATVMIGLNTKDAPKKPPKLTYTVGSGTDSTSDTENSEREDFTTETVDTSDTTETDVTDTTEKSEVSDTESEPIHEIPNDEPTELQTTEPTEEPTEAPTEVPTEKQTDEPTEPSESETEPVVTEPKPSGPAPLGSLKPSIYYPETTQTDDVTDEPTLPTETSETEYDTTIDTPEISKAPDDEGTDVEVDDPEEYYELSFIPQFIIENAGVFDINGKILPDEIPTCIAKGTEFDLREYLVYLTDYLGATCDESMLNSVDFGDKVSLTYYLNDEFRTSFDAFRIEIPEYPIPAVRSYRYYISMRANNVELNGSEIYTFDEVFDYATSLPHFKIALSYAGITDGEYDVHKTFTRGENGSYNYDFTFIPKTDDPVESFLYRNSKYVRIAGNVGLGEEYSGVYFEADNTVFEVEKNWEYTQYSEIREAFLTELEKYGVREYCEENMICYLTNSNSNKVYIKPYFKFRVAFTDEEGNIIYCQPEVVKKNKYGYTKCYHIGEVEIIR